MIILSYLQDTKGRIFCILSQILFESIFPNPVNMIIWSIICWLAWTWMYLVVGVYASACSVLRKQQLCNLSTFFFPPLGMLGCTDLISCHESYAVRSPSVPPPLPLHRDLPWLFMGLVLLSVIWSSCHGSLCPPSSPLQSPLSPPPLNQTPLSSPARLFPPSSLG